ncbi:vWA domain-containing protein [Anaerohalosphaeraceae bacterium U12dextr]
MEWLSPMMGIWAAAVSVPLLVLLYFLKLKRREQLISSTLLWKKAVQDLQVNAPFQKIRRNILLLLQLLALGAVLLALAGPVLRRMGTGPRRYVLLIDRSASMNATDVLPSRLAEAKRQARVFIDSLPQDRLFSLNQAQTQVMAIAFDKTAKVVCNFTSDRQQLLRAIDAIEPGDGASQIGQALVAARAFAQPAEDDSANHTGQAQARLLLFSDGRIEDLPQQVVGQDELEYYAIGQHPDNLGIIAMQARRDFEDTQRVDVFLTLANYGPNPAASDVEFAVNDTVVSVRPVNVDKESLASDGQTMLAGKTSMEFSFRSDEAAVVSVRVLRADALMADNTAYAVVSARKHLSVALVSAGNAVLRSALKACGPARLDEMTVAEFQAKATTDLVVQQPYDVIVLDNVTIQTRPRARYLVFGQPPAGIDVAVGGELENQYVADWRARHPVLQYVNLNTLFAARGLMLQIPRDAEILAEFTQGPAISVLRRQGSVFILTAFDVLATNWPFEPGFVLYCYNAMQYLAAQASAETDGSLRPGEPIIVEGLPAQTETTVSGPGIESLKLTATDAGLVRLPAAEHAGLYRMDFAGREPKYFAVNLNDEQESRIEPVKTLTLSGREIQAQTKPLSRANLPLWPYLVLAALGLCLLEWWVYTGKMKL